MAHESAGDVLVVVVPHAYLDASNSKEFRGDVVALIGERKKVVLNLRNVQFLDSSACGVFIGLLRQVKGQGGDLKLCAVTKSVRSLFELIRMHKVFDILNTSEEAIAAFQV